MLFSAAAAVQAGGGAGQGRLAAEVLLPAFVLAQAFLGALLGTAGAGLVDVLGAFGRGDQNDGVVGHDLGKALGHNGGVPDPVHLVPGLARLNGGDDGLMPGLYAVAAVHRGNDQAFDLTGEKLLFRGENRLMKGEKA